MIWNELTKTFWRHKLLLFWYLNTPYFDICFVDIYVNLMIISVQNYNDIYVYVMLRYTCKVMLVCVNYLFALQVYNVALCKCLMFSKWLLISVYRSCWYLCIHKSFWCFLVYTHIWASIVVVIQCVALIFMKGLLISVKGSFWYLC